MKLPPKNSAVQREISSHSHRPGEAAIGRVSRVYRKEKSGNEVRRRRRRKSSKHRRPGRVKILAWSLVALVVTGGVLVATFLLWLWPQMKSKDASWRQVAEAERQVRVETRFVAPDSATALSLVASALDVADEAAVEKYIRTGPATASEVLAFMRDAKEQEGDPAERIWLGSIDRNGLQLEGVELIYQTSDQPKHRLALLVPDEQGVWRMDFGAFARKMEPPWDILIARYPPPGGAEPPAPPPTGTLRAMFVGDNYFNWPFDDEEAWVAYGMLSTDHPDIQLIGYCQKGSLQHRAMEHILSKWPEDVLPRITVEVRRVPEAEARQLEITSVLAEDWVIGDRKFEELIDQGWR